MSENNKSSETPGGQPKSGKDGKKFPNTPRFNFNFYWIYGIIIVILIITQFFQWGTAEHKILFDDFERTMLLTKDVDRIVVTNDVAHIYIKKDKLADAKAKFSLLLIDACRDNPLPKKAGRSIGATRGLAQPASPNGQIVLFSAGANPKALLGLEAALPDAPGTSHTYGGITSSSTVFQ